MGSMHQEDSMNSSSDQEGDRPDQENNEMGTGRSYECVFCKRGFNTAQALGGHMNIHRKDRAKNRPALITSHKNEEIHVGTRFFPQISSLPTRYFSDPEVQVNYGTFIPVSTSDSSPLYATHEYVFCGQNSQITEPLNLPLQFGSFPNGEYHGEEEREIGSKEDQLDLELRLGHYP